MNIEEVLSSHGVGGKKGLVRRTGTQAVINPTMTVTLPVAYEATTEVLFVFQNGILLQPTSHYTVNGTTVTRVGTTAPWNKGTIIEFIVIGGSVTPSGTFDGSLATNGTITNAKLHTDAKVGSLAGLQTLDKTSVVAAINEIQSNLNSLRGPLSQSINDILDL